MTRRFVLDFAWPALLAALDLRASDLLRRAGLPEGLLNTPRPTLNADDFAALWDAMTASIATPTPGLYLGQAFEAESFSPPLLAAFCSPDLKIATERLSRFKPLVGPLILESHDMAAGLELTFDAEPGVFLPREYIAAELVFLVHLARLATKTDMRPIAVEMRAPPDHEDYAAFFGRDIRKGPFNRVVFSATDARRPFLSANPALFKVFESDLQSRLDEMDQGASTTERLRAVLTEVLPAGQADVGVSAKRLGMSSRTLQRRLGSEGTSFQEELKSIRETLARDYLSQKAVTNAEIAYLLGYEDPNSFFRAFHEWTGTTPDRLRKSA